MFVIYNRDEGMYLLAAQNGMLGVLTCLWGEDRRDAMTFESAFEARKTARRIGNCDVAVLFVEPKGDGG